MKKNIIDEHIAQYESEIKKDEDRGMRGTYHIQMNRAKIQALKKLLEK